MNSTLLMQNIFLHTSYYFMLALLICWAWSGWREWHTFSMAPRLFLEKMFVGILTAAALTLVIWKGIGPSYKVLSDESNLMGVARSMFLDRTVKHVLTGEYYYDNLWPLSVDVPKRPFMYPLLVSFFHVLFGYSINNGFYVNGVTLFLLLCWVFGVFSSLAGKWVGVAAQLLVAAQPIVGITATSAGYDTLSLLLQLIMLTSLWQLLHRVTPQRLLFLWWTGMVLANVRYETLLFLPFLFGCLWMWGLLKWQDLRVYKWHYFSAPLFCISRVLQMILKAGTYENPPGVPVLGWVNFVKHLPIFIRNLFDFSFSLPYATLLTLLALACIGIECGWTLANQVRKREPRWNIRILRFAFALLGVVGGGLLIYLSHHFGRYEHPTQARLFIVFAAVTSLVPLLALRWVSPAHLESAKKWCLVIGAVFFALYFPIAAEGRFVNRLTGIRTAHAALGFFRSIGTHNILIVTDSPGQYVVEDFGAVNFQYARQNEARILNNLKRHLYQDIYLMETVDYTTNKVKEGGLSGAPAEPVFSFQLSATEFIRISRVVL
jgi:hypothetical protein